MPPPPPAPPSDPPAPAGASPQGRLAPGTRLAHYRLGEAVGAGAMGTVYRAHDEGLDRGVAVKVLHAQIAEDDRVVDRFQREARAAARVSHPNLAHVYYVGQAEGRWFFAMEHVEGRNLEEEVRQDGPLPLEAAVDVLVQAARGLSAAHRVGVVHRDVKPSNLIRRPDGVVKVTDFGLARSLSGDLDASAAGSVTGTPTYMSPEQVRGESTDPRSDVYALGLTAFTLLAGQPPFPGPTLGKVLSDQLNTPIPALALQRPDLPPAVDAVLARLCAKDPAHRPASMDDALRLLLSLRPQRVVRAPLAARAVAFGIDVTAVLVLWAALGFGLVRLFGEDALPGWTSDLALWALWTGSQLGPEAWRQTSLGKWLLHLAVLREDGLAPARRQLVLRLVARTPDVALTPLTLLAAFSPWLLEAAAMASNALTLLALLAGLLCWVITRGRTLSDVLTRTTVAYRHPGTTDAHGPAGPVDGPALSG